MKIKYKLVLAIFVVFLCAFVYTGVRNKIEYDSIESYSKQASYVYVPVVTKSQEPEKVEIPIDNTENDVKDSVDENDVYLIALMTMTEAEGEPEDGKRMVIDTALNRVDHKAFPNTVYDVIYQQHQFSGMTGSRLEKCKRAFENDSELKEYFCQLVREEMIERMNYDVIFFHAKKYIQYGTPMFSIGNHYFSKY